MRRVKAIAVSAVAMFCLFHGNVLSAQESELTAEQSPAIFDRRPETSNAARALAGSSAAALLSKARAQGSLRVIVTVNTGRSPSAADAGSDAEDRAAIHAAQQALLQDIGMAARPSMDGNEDQGSTVQLSEYFPWIYLDATAEVITKLLKHPAVLRIRESTADAVPALASSVPWINADDIWRRGFTGTGQAVAIIDTGVDGSHPMLRGKIPAGTEACFSSRNAAANESSTCPNGALSSTAAGAGAPCDASVKQCDHGTHVASIAAGLPISGVNIGGVAKGAGIIPIKVATTRRTGNCGPWTPPCATIRYDNTVQALEHVYRLSASRKIAAVNMSLSGRLYSGSCDADELERATVIRRLIARGVAVIAATGNDSARGRVGTPSCITGVVAVGNSIDPNDTLAPTSNHSPRVDLLAPGTNINAAVPMRNGQAAYATKTGTSQASPHVAGAWALLKSAKPTASNDSILEALRCTGKPIDAGGVVKPRIDVLAAYEVLAGIRSCAFDVTIFDDGTLKDDVFVLSVDGRAICETPTGGLRKCSVQGVKAGTHRLSVFVKVAPDNVGTYSVDLANGLRFSDGSTTKSAAPPQGATIDYNIVVPTGRSLGTAVKQNDQPIDYNAARQPG